MRAAIGCGKAACHVPGDIKTAHNLGRDKLWMDAEDAAERMSRRRRNERRNRAHEPNTPILEGEAAGTKGYFVMSDEWMDEFVYQVVVDPSFVEKEVRDVLNKEPVVLPLWDPMGALA